MEATRKAENRLRRQIVYFAGVAMRSVSRERIREAHRAIRERELQLTALEHARKAPEQP